MGKQKTPEQVQEVLRDRQAGMSLTQLALKHKFSRTGIREFLRRYPEAALSKEESSKRMSGGGRLSWKIRVGRGTTPDVTKLNTPELIAQRALTRRQNTATRHGHTSPAARYEEVARARGGAFLGPAAAVHGDTGWRCGKGHEWQASPHNVLFNGTWCPSCASTGPSAPEQEVLEYVRGLGVEVVANTRTVIKPLELDIYVPDFKLGLEYNGLLYHSDYFGADIRGRHYRKARACQDAGVNLFAFFSDEWANRPELVKAMIRYRVHRFQGTVLRASQLKLEPVTDAEMEPFFSRNHIDGHTRASSGYGLFLGDVMVQCLSIRTNHRREREIARLATDYDYRVHGGAQKLLQVVAVKGKPLISFSNNRLSTGSVYKQLGFKFLQHNRSSYWYTDGKSRVWRFGCRRQNAPEVLAQHPTEALQARAGVMSQKFFGDDRPLYRVEDYGHMKWGLTP